MNKKLLYVLAAGHLSVDINSGSLPRKRNPFHNVHLWSICYSCWWLVF